MVDQALDVVFIFLGLGVVDGEYFHGYISWVREVRERDSHLSKVSGHISGRPLEDNIAVTHQNDFVKVNVSVRARLVDRSQHSFTLSSLLLQKLDNRVGFETIET